MKSNTEERYAVYVYSCPCNLPVPFLRHNWIVTDDNGQLDRWEAGYVKNIGVENYGYLRRNLRAASYDSGITIAPGLGDSARWPGRITGRIVGGRDSLANRMVEFIKQSPRKYPYRNQYKLLGPNSNTYVGWVLDSFPDSGLKLSLNSPGRKYRGK